MYEEMRKKMMERCVANWGACNGGGDSDGIMKWMFLYAGPIMLLVCSAECSLLMGQAKETPRMKDFDFQSLEQSIQNIYPPSFSPLRNLLWIKNQETSIPKFRGAVGV